MSEHQRPISRSHSIFTPNAENGLLRHLEPFLPYVEKRDRSQNQPVRRPSKPKGPRLFAQDDGSKRFLMRHEAFLPYVEKARNEIHHVAEASVHSTKNNHISIDVIRYWLQFCEAAHGKDCQYTRLPSRRKGGTPGFLIDVVKECLVLQSATATPRYVALSYVWGSNSGDCTQKNNVILLQEPGGLLNGHVQLPPVVKDTMALVHQLGEQWLWVDRFCLIQDDQLAMEKALDSMDLIYSCAIFSIVAAQNDDASQGLYGQRTLSTQDGSDSRIPSSQDLNRWGAIPEQSDGRVILRQAENLMNTKWYSRSWTFQEYFFSYRRVVFQDNTVNWECQRASWHENQKQLGLVKVASPGTTDDNQQEMQHMSDPDKRPWPDIRRYSRMLALFNGRELSYPEDALDAFSGILRHLDETAYPDGFITGLPRFCFDAALLWQPWSPMERRKPKLRSRDATCLPSWSWLGWHGTLNSESWRSAASYVDEMYDDDLESADGSPTVGSECPVPGCYAEFGAEYCRGRLTRHGRMISRRSTASCDHTDSEISESTLVTVERTSKCSWKTFSTVAWSCSSQLSEEKEKLGPCSFHSTNGDTNRQVLPKGWSKWKDASGEWTYRHDSDPTQRFYYPIPIRDKSVDYPNGSRRARYLHANTRRACMRTGAIYATNASRCAAIDILYDGRWAGVLRLNARLEDAEQELRGNDTLCSIAPEALESSSRTKFVELVELSAGSVEYRESEKKSFDEWNKLEVAEPGNIYEFYNVVWVEWHLGIAYRKALGRIMKKAWEESAIEKLELTLG